MRQCGICGKSGHNARTCSRRSSMDMQNNKKPSVELNRNNSMATQSEVSGSLLSANSNNENFDGKPYERLKDSDSKWISDGSNNPYKEWCRMVGFKGLKYYEEHPDE